MSEENYHDLPQPYRIQKRLALNQCFRSIREAWDDSKCKIGYVTFGGEDIYDAMDLVGVFSVRDHEIAIISYEQHLQRAELSRTCAVAATLSQVRTITVDIVPAPFPSVVDRLEAIREGRPLIMFLDYTGTFRDKEANDIEMLLNSGLIREGDFLLITSSLTPRVVHNMNFMARYDQSFRLMFGVKAVDNEFRGRNLVDLLVALSFSRFEKSERLMGRADVPSANLLKKFRYRDSKCPMGLWLYAIRLKRAAVRHLKDVLFDDFPQSFETIAARIPNIFD